MCLNLPHPWTRPTYDAKRHPDPIRRFYRATACNATHGIAVAILSVRLSVRQMRVL